MMFPKSKIHVINIKSIRTQHQDSPRSLKKQPDPCSSLSAEHESYVVIFGAEDNLLAPAKTRAFRCTYCDKMGQKEGHDVAPAAVHTGQHGRTLVKFNNQAEEAKT